MIKAGQIYSTGLLKWVVTHIDIVELRELKQDD